MTATVRPHESLEALLPVFLKTLHEVRRLRVARGGLPRPIPVVVPAGHFSDWLHLRLARSEGVSMGIEFLRPLEFVARISAFLDQQGAEEWTRDALTWRLLPEIAQIAGQLGMAEDRELSSREAFATARLLADHFEHYGHSRPELLSAWREDGPAPARELPANAFARQSEPWQRDLWRRLDQAIKTQHPHAEHPGLLLLRKGRIAASKAQNTFPEVLVLGTGGLEALLVQTLSLLAEAGSAVFVDVVLPSLDYLSEFREPERRMPLLADPESDLPPGGGHPLVSTLARHAVGSFLLLEKLDESYSHWPELGMQAPAPLPPTLLSTLQHAIRANQADASTASLSPVPVDLSLQLHACHGARRELEVLRDALLQAFTDIPGLRPEEVLVLCSDYDAYAPLFDAVLAQGVPPLPIRLTEKSLSTTNPLLDALTALLALAQGRHEISHLLEFLDLIAVQAALGLSSEPKQLEHLKDWLRASGLTHDIDSEDRQHKDLPDEETGTWRFARDRITAGLLFGPNCPVKDQAGRHLLPLGEHLESDRALRQAFCTWLSLLETHLREWRTPAPVSDWATRLSAAVDQLLRPDPRDSQTVSLRKHLEFLRSRDCQTHVDTAVLEDWFRGLLEAEAGSRVHASGHITVGRFKQLNQLPCKVLAMVGMSDGAFPRQQRLPAWDLLQLDPRPWDRNPRIEDRQLFLDALLAPSKRLIITASVINLRSGKQEPFSSCVDELLNELNRSIGSDTRDTLLQKHRLQPFAEDYFLARSGLATSFNANAYDVACALRQTRLGSRTEMPFVVPGEGPPAPAPSSSLELTLTQLGDFWADPARAWVRAQGIALPREVPDDLLLNQTPLSLDALQQWLARNALLQEVLEGGSDEAHAQARLAGARALPLGALGKELWSGLRKLPIDLAALIQTHRSEQALEGLVELTTPLGTFRLSGRLSLGTFEGRSCLLVHRLGCVDKPKHLLQAWISALFGSALSGVALPCLILDQEAASTAQPDLTLRAGIAPEEAKALLALLVDGLRLGQHRPLCFAPQASAAYAKKLYVKDAVGYLDQLRGTESAFATKLVQWVRERVRDPSSHVDETDAVFSELDKRLNEDLFAQIEEQWDSDSEYASGEGTEPACRLAWRGRRAFAPEHAQEWHAWALALSLSSVAWFCTEEASQ